MTTNPFDAGDPSMRMGFDLVIEPGAAADHIYLEVATVVATFLLAGRYFEMRAKRRAGAALRALLVHSRRARLEILLPPDLARDDLGRPLWDLARRLTSAVAVHRLSDDTAPLAEAWLTVDRHGYLHRPQAERLHGLACLDDPPRTQELTQRFAALWLASEPDPDLRRLSL